MTVPIGVLNRTEGLAARIAELVKTRPGVQIRFQAAAPGETAVPTRPETPQTPVQPTRETP